MEEISLVTSTLDKQMDRDIEKDRQKVAYKDKNALSSD